MTTTKNAAVTTYTNTSGTSIESGETGKTRKAHVRLTEEQKSEIRTLLADGMKQSEIAKQFNCSSVTVSNVKRNYQTIKPRGVAAAGAAPVPVTDHTVIKARVFVG